MRYNEHSGECSEYWGNHRESYGVGSGDTKGLAAGSCGSGAAFGLGTVPLRDTL